MTTSSYLRVKHPHILHEIIEGEAILVNLETGSYYSADQVGAVIWNGIENGKSADEIVTAVSGAYAGDDTEIETQVRAFLQQLQAERLVLPSETPEREGSGAFTLPTNAPPFVTPVLKKYTEMEDLLLLDPIHDVDAGGWPHQTESTA